MAIYTEICVVVKISFDKLFHKSEPQGTWVLLIDDSTAQFLLYELGKTSVVIRIREAVDYGVGFSMLCWQERELC